MYVEFRVGVTTFVTFLVSHLPMRPNTPDGGSSHRRRSAKDLVPEFSLQMNNILRLSVASISIKARMRIAIDFDLPAPKSPWIHRSNRLVSNAIVTAQSVPKTCPSSSASRGEAHPLRDMELALGVATGRTNARNVIFCCHPFLQLPFGHYRCLIPGGICTGEFARQR